MAWPSWPNGQHDASRAFRGRFGRSQSVERHCSRIPPDRQRWGLNHRTGWWENLQESPIFMVKTMVSCRFSLKPIHWLKDVDRSVSQEEQDVGVPDKRLSLLMYTVYPPNCQKTLNNDNDEYRWNTFFGGTHILRQTQITCLTFSNAKACRCYWWFGGSNAQWQRSATFSGCGKVGCGRPPYFRSTND